MSPSSTKSRPSSGSITLVSASSTSSSVGIQPECITAAGWGRVARIVRFEPQPPTLCCSGDEDVTTQGCRRAALSRALTAQHDVRVDLHELRFADASLMVDLVMIAGRLRKAGCHMVLESPQPQI